MTKYCNLLVVGFDSLDQELARTWAAEGVMPNFKSLMDQSCWGLVGNEPGLEAGTAWPTFYRGVSVGSHGQLDATRQFDTTKYEVIRVGNDRFKHQLIWQRLSDEGKRVAVIDAPYTYLTENLNGIEIHDWGVHAGVDGDLLGLMTWPPSLAGEVMKKFGKEPLNGKLCDFYKPRTPEEMIGFRDALISRVETKTAMLKHYLTQGGWDFFLTIFSEAHCMGHHAWHIHDTTRPDHDPEIAKQVGNPLRDIYIRLDQALGEILANVDLGETNLLVHLSHGIGPSVSGTRLLDKILVKLEGGELKDKSKGFEGLLRTAWRSLPEFIRKTFEPVRKEAWLLVVKDPFQGNREKRQYFEIIANDRTGGVRVNLIGRELYGTVQPGAEYDAILDQLTSDLMDITNTDTGAPLVKEIIRTKDAYHGDSVNRLPDLLVTWNRDGGSGQIRKVYSPKIGEIEHDGPPPRSGDHRPLGMFLASGPDVFPGRKNEITPVMDIAPTLAQLLGCSLEGFEGVPIEQLSVSLQEKELGTSY